MATRSTVGGLRVSICRLIFLATTCGLCAQDFGVQPSTKPSAEDRAVYRSNVDMVNMLLDSPSDDELTSFGHIYRGQNDFPRAAIVHLTALRGKRNNPQIEYELACDFGLWGQAKLGMDYLQMAADDGYWGYRVVTEDTDVDPLKGDPRYSKALAKIKASFAVELPKNGPGSTVKLPAGSAPKTGWPAVVFLHGWASNRHDFDDNATLVATLGYIGISLDATEPMGPGAYTWADKSVEPTRDTIMSAIRVLATKVDPKRIYLAGFSQGAMHAARLLADYPGDFAGAICNSPGSGWLLPIKLASPAHTGTIVLSVGSRDAIGIARNVAKIEALWRSAGRPVHVIRFDGGHQLPPDPDAMYRASLAQMATGN